MGQGIITKVNNFRPSGNTTRAKSPSRLRAIVRKARKLVLSHYDRILCATKFLSPPPCVSDSSGNPPSLSYGGRSPKRCLARGQVVADSAARERDPGALGGQRPHQHQRDVLPAFLMLAKCAILIKKGLVIDKYNYQIAGRPWPGRSGINWIYIPH